MPVPRVSVRNRVRNPMRPRDGTRNSMRTQPVPWFVKVMARLMRKKFVTRPMPRNFRVGGVEAGTYGTEVVAFDDGLRRFRAAIDRLEREAPTRPSPVFGPLTHEEWKNLHLRHAELHLGFLDYPTSTGSR